MEKSLKELLARLPIPGLKESTDRHIIAETITELLNIPIKPSQITFRDSIISVSAQPVVKSALQIKQEALLARLRAQDIQASKVR